MADSIPAFWDSVQFPESADDCWEWQGRLTPDGYGSFRRGHAHRHSWVLHHGVVPRGKILRHTCDNRICVNPAHLVVGTHADNARDRVERGRSARGESNGQSKLTEADVLAIRASGESDAALGRRYRTATSTIRFARIRKTWKHI